MRSGAPCSRTHGVMSRISLQSLSEYQSLTSLDLPSDPSVVGKFLRVFKHIPDKASSGLHRERDVDRRTTKQLKTPASDSEQQRRRVLRLTVSHFGSTSRMTCGIVEQRTTRTRPQPTLPRTPMPGQSTITGRVFRKAFVQASSQSEQYRLWIWVKDIWSCIPGYMWGLYGLACRLEPISFGAPFWMDFAASQTESSRYRMPTMQNGKTW